MRLHLPLAIARRRRLSDRPLATGPCLALLALSLLVAACGPDESTDTGAGAKQDAVEDVGAADVQGKCQLDEDCEASVHPCRKMVCDPALGCLEKVLPEGSICLHPNGCTEGGVCSSVGKCEGAEVKKCDDKDPCTVDACNPATGKCASTAAPDGSPCDDGDTCSVGDTCQSGKCLAGGRNICGCKTNDDCVAKDSANKCEGVHYCDKSLEVPECKLNPASVVTCAKNEGLCESNACEPATGKCVMTPHADGTLCDDGNSCTVNTKCEGGGCKGGEAICKCQKDADCLAKDDGNLCNGVMYCNLASANCELNPSTVVSCPSVDDTQCLRNVCLPKTGKCAQTPLEKLQTCAKGEGCVYKPLGPGEKPSTEACDDGNPCTPDDICKEGVCTANANTCTCKQDQDCVDKDDGDLCNGTMFCNQQTGMCEVNPKTVVNCQSVFDKPCEKYTCVPKTGACELLPAPDDLPCDADGSVCTPYDTCQQGKCVVGKNICSCGESEECAKWEDGDLCNGTLFCNKQKAQCTIDPQTVVGCPSVDDTQCKKNLCQPKTGQCKVTFMPKDFPCEDNLPCTQNDGCDNGACKSGVDVCDCQQDKDCALVEDGNLCNGTLYCDKTKLPWKCLVNPATLVKCPTVEDNYCQTNTCKPTSGQCLMVFKHTDEPCDDGDPCTKETICKVGKCQDPLTGAKKKCDDDNVCTDDGCDSKLGCVNTPNNAACQDGNACTDGDGCAGGKCVPGKLLDCDDKNPCTTEVCHQIGGCLDFPNSDPCDDGDACTLADACKSAKCVSGSPKNCSDGNICTWDTCDPKSAKGDCAHKADAAKACDDGVACTIDTCDPVLGCKHLPQSVACDDKVGCTKDVCNLGGGCENIPQAGLCADEGACVEVQCQPAVGCVKTPVFNGKPCFDTDPCTVGDACKDGKCAAGPKAPLCGVDAKQCEGKADGTPCNDGNSCTGQEACLNGACRPAVKSVFVRTLFGNGSGYTRDDIAWRGSVYYPCGVAMDGAGNMFVANTGNHVIQRIDLSGRAVTVAGSITGGAGFQDAAGTQAQFYSPCGLAFDASGTLYVADYNNQRVRKMTPDGKVTTLAGNGKKAFVDGKGPAASFYDPVGVAVDKQGDVFVAELSNHRVRRIKPDGTVSVFAGSVYGNKDGKGAQAQFRSPFGLAFGPKGNLFVTENTGHRVRRISPDGTVVTFAGSTAASYGYKDATGLEARFNTPAGIVADASGVLYIAEIGNHRVRRILPDGAVTTIAGSGVKGWGDGLAKDAKMDEPRHLAFNSEGHLVVADYRNHRVRLVELRRDTCSGVDTCNDARCEPASGKCVASKVCDDGSPCTLDTCDASTGACSFKNADIGTACDDGDACTQAVQCSNGVCRPHAKVVTWSGASHGEYDGSLTNARYYNPHGLAVDAANNVYLADSSNHLIRKITPSGRVHTFAGSPWNDGGYANGPGTAARFNLPLDLDLDAAGNVYVSDYYNNRIRKITPAGVVTSLAGNGQKSYADGAGASASFRLPYGIAVTPDGIVYVGDYENHRIRRIMPDGTTSTLAGDGTPAERDGPANLARFTYPAGLALDNQGNVLVADLSGHTIRRVGPDGYVTTVAGIGKAGLRDGSGAAAAMFNGPRDLAVDASGNIYVADAGNHAVRAIFTDGSVATVGGGQWGGSYWKDGLADGIGTEALFNDPAGVLVRADGSVLIADRDNHRLRVLTPAIIDCSDGNDCTLDSCGRFKGCVHVPATSACSDGDPCTAGDKCSAGKCLAGGKVAGCQCAGKTCSDGDACTDDGCDPAKGCVWQAIEDGTACDDGSPCTEDDRCVGGKCSPNPGKWVVETFAGKSLGERDGFRLPIAGAVADARFAKLADVNFDAAGNLYVGDANNHIIRRITTDGYVQTLAGRAHHNYPNGTVDAKRFAAAFNHPSGVDTDAAGNAYIAEYLGHRIRKLAPDGTVTTLAGSGKAGFADGKGSAAQFNGPQGVASDAVGNLYVADRNNHRIRKVGPDGQVTTLAGSATAGYFDGMTTGARFYRPNGISFGADGYLYVTEYDNNTVRRISVDGVVTTVAGHNDHGYRDGFGVIGARFGRPHGATADAKGRVFVVDSDNSKVRLVLPWGETVTIAGGSGAPTAGYANGPGEQARFNWLYRVALDNLGRVYVTDHNNYRIRRLREVGTSCDDGNPCTTDACDPKQGCVHTTADPAVACPDGGPCVVPSCDLKAGVCKYTSRPDGYLCGDPGDCHKQCNQGACMRAAVGWDYAGSGYGNKDGPASEASFNRPFGIAIDAKDKLYVADRENHRIRVVDTDGTVSTLAGSSYGYAEGEGTAARFNHPIDVAIAAAGHLWVADYANNRVRKVTLAGKVSTLAGSTQGYKEGTGTLAQFSNPLGVVADGKGGVYVSDSSNNRIRHIDASGKTTLVAGSGQKDMLDAQGDQARFYSPGDLALDGQGGLMVADGGNNALRRIDLSDGSVQTLVGMDRMYNDATYLNGTGPLGTAMSWPRGIALLPDGSWVVADTNNDAIRRVWIDGSSETLAGSPGDGHSGGIGHDVRLRNPMGVAVGADGDIYVADYDNHRIRRLSTKLSKCSHLVGISRYAAGKSCKSIQPQQKWKNISAWWVDPDGDDKANSFKTVCDMKTADGGWTRVDVQVEPKDVQLLLGSKGRMMLKCSDFGAEHLYSPASDKPWAWANKKEAVAGTWVANGKNVVCGADKAFDQLECGFGFGCSEGAAADKPKVMPGVKNTTQCANTTTAQTSPPFSICSSNANFSGYRVFVRTDD